MENTYEQQGGIMGTSAKVTEMRIVTGERPYFQHDGSAEGPPRAQFITEDNHVFEVAVTEIKARQAREGKG